LTNVEKREFLKTETGRLRKFDTLKSKELAFDSDEDDD